MDQPPTQIRYLNTVEAYDLWSEIYDTDGNFLQALDTLEMKVLLPRLLESIVGKKPWKLVDLGCGTGRNTVALLQVPESTVIGLDGSPRMLEVAKSRLTAREGKTVQGKSPLSRIEFEVYDILSDEPVPKNATAADAVISTLVLEHIPVNIFLSKARQMLNPGGFLLVTNMHSEMGVISQAGFTDPKTGEKVRPYSYAHRLDDVIKAAEKEGFIVTGDVLERAVDEKMSQVLGPRAKKWIGVTVWFGVMFQRVE